MPPEIQPGDSLTKEGEVLAKVSEESDGITIEYELADNLAGKYDLAMYPDGSVKLVFNGPINSHLEEFDYLSIKVRLFCIK